MKFHIEAYNFNNNFARNVSILSPFDIVEIIGTNTWEIIRPASFAWTTDNFQALLGASFLGPVFYLLLVNTGPRPWVTPFTRKILVNTTQKVFYSKFNLKYFFFFFITFINFEETKLRSLFYVYGFQSLWLYFILQCIDEKLLSSTQ